jgi:hypothetical protein
MQLITLTIWCGTGANFSERSNGYTHAMVAWLPSGLFKLKTIANFEVFSRSIF